MLQPTHQKGINGQFKLEHNVEYKIINRFKLAELLATKGIIVSKRAMGDLELMKAEALKKSNLTKKEVEELANLCARPLFQENKVGKGIVSLARKFINPLTADGVVRKGFFSDLALNGLQIPGLTGNWGISREIKNLVTNAGFAGVASRINGAGGEAAFTYIALGTGATAANAADTTLQTESTTNGSARTNSTASRVTTTQTNDTAQLVNTFNLTGTFAFTESGVLNASSNGVLLCRQVFSAINVVNGDSLQITWKIKAA